jgi:hypothetical protein
VLTAKEELAHLAECLTEAEAERALAVLYERCPELYGEAPRRTVIRGDGRVVTVVVPDDE